MGYKKTFPIKERFLKNFSKQNYMLTVVDFALSLQQAFFALASVDDFEQLALLSADFVQQV